MAKRADGRAHAVRGAGAARRQEPAPSARTIAVPELDRVIHERMRLAIVSALAVNDTMTFGELKGVLAATDGNLSVHARKLEEAGYVQCAKGYEGRVPRTDYRLTAAGRKALEKYLAHMEAIIRATRKG